MQQPTEFFLDYQYLVDEFEDAKHRYEQRTGKNDYHQEIFNITNTYLRLERQNYLKFGPYWWAVKAIMDRRGFHGYQGNGEPILRDAYSMRKPDTQEIDDYATLVAAWQFKDHYNAHYFQGNREFVLWDTGEIYYLFDMDFEQRL